MAHEFCHHLMNDLSDYLDDGLGPDICAEIEQHLAECENCQIVVDTLKKTIYLVRQENPNEPLPADIRQRLYKRLDLEAFRRPPASAE